MLWLASTYLKFLIYLFQPKWSRSDNFILAPLGLGFEIRSEWKKTHVSVSSIRSLRRAACATLLFWGNLDYRFLSDGQVGVDEGIIWPAFIVAQELIA